jgi:hypothetical protein
MIADNDATATAAYSGATFVIADEYSTFSDFSNCSSDLWAAVKACLEEPPVYLPSTVKPVMKMLPVRAIKIPPPRPPIQQPCWRMGRWKSLTGGHWRAKKA